MFRSRPFRALAIGLVVVLLVVMIAGWKIYQLADDSMQSEKRSELFKNTMQLAIVVIVGGAVAFGYKEIDRARDESREHYRLRQQYLARLGNAYRSVKESRRLLRAAGLTNAYGQQATVLSESQIQSYDTHVQALNRAQLDLEALNIESEYFLPDVDAKALAKCIKQMEEYLKIIIGEYERFRPTANINFDRMSALREFTGDPPKDTWDDIQEGTFYGDFVVSHRDAIRLVSGDRLTIGRAVVM